MSTLSERRADYQKIKSIKQRIMEDSNCNELLEVLTKLEEENLAKIKELRESIAAAREQYFSALSEVRWKGKKAEDDYYAEQA